MRCVKFLSASLTLLLCCAFGCSSNVQFGGKVTFSDDDSPVAKGTVIFEKEGYMARGSLDEQGVYKLGAEKIDGGLEKGEYKVYISGAVEAQTLELERDEEGNLTQRVVMPDVVPKGAQILGDKMLVPTVDPSFCDAKTTPLTVSVDGKTKKFDFKVDRNVP